jgi:hypothetical protein
MPRKPLPPPETCPRCEASLIGVKYSHQVPEHYDGISEYACPNRQCGYRVGRWTRQIIPPGFIESRKGTRGLVKVKYKK